MKKSLFFAALIFFCVMLSPLYAAEIVKIGVLNFPPYYFVEEGKEPSGAILDFLKAAVEKAGFKYEIKGFPPKRLYRNLCEGESQVFAGLKGIPAYDGQVLYSKKKITDIDMRIYARPETPMIKSKEELKGKKIMTILGYNYPGIFPYLTDPANHIELDPALDHEILFKKLKAKRGDYALDYRQPSENALHAVDIPDVQSHSLIQLEVVLIVSQKTPKAQELLDKLEEAVEDLKKEGKFPNT